MKNSTATALAMCKIASTSTVEKIFKTTRFSLHSCTTNQHLNIDHLATAALRCPGESSRPCGPGPAPCPRAAEYQRAGTLAAERRRNASPSVALLGRAPRRPCHPSGGAVISTTKRRACLRSKHTERGHRRHNLHALRWLLRLLRWLLDHHWRRRRCGRRC